VKGLWESLSRAGGHFSDQAMMVPSEGGAKFIIKLKDKLSEDSKRYAFKFMKAYLDECGWKTTRMKVEPFGYVSFEMRPSSRSR